MFNEEGSAMYRIGKIMQGKYHTMPERSLYNDLTPDIKLDIVEYIKECSIEQQHLLPHDNRKNYKLLYASIKRKKYNVKESSLVILEMKENSQQLETSTVELAKIRSNTNEESSLPIKEELQLDTAFTQGNLEKISKIQIQRIRGNSYKSNYVNKKNERKIVQTQQWVVII